jgi:nitrate reductase NapD
MNITGLLIQALPAKIDAVRLRVAALAGVEVHAVTPEGRFVVTVERGGDDDMTRAFGEINAIDGVCATTLIYHHSETIENETLSAEESKS